MVRRRAQRAVSNHGGRFGLAAILRDTPASLRLLRLRSEWCEIHSSIGGQMNLVTHKKFKGDRLMPWGKATVVTGAKGYVFLSGNTATVEDYDPLKQRGGAI